jgi:hypothetical protein
MGSLSLVGNDTIKIGDRLLADFGPGEVAKISYATELATVKTGKNGNTIFVQNASGFQASLEVKVIRGSADDKALQTFLTSYRSDPVLYVVQNAELVKKLGDGAGKVTADTYVLTGGIPTKQVEAVVNVEGDTEQAISVYTWVFATSDRAIT